MDRTSEGPPATGAAPAHEGFERMQQLTIYIKETDHVEHRPLYLKILELARTNGGAGATVFKGIAGYSSTSRTIQTAGFADVQQHLPLMLVIVDTAWRIELLLPQLEGLVRANGGLITVQDLEAHSYLHPNLAQAGRSAPPLQVADIMERHVVTVRPDTPAADVLPMLLGRYYKSLPVIDDAHHVVGIIADGDLLEKGKVPFRLSILEALEAGGERGLQEVLAELRTSQRTARDIMTPAPITTTGPDALAVEAARLMLQHSVKRIPVVDGSGRLAGIVGRLDIFKSAEAIFPQLGPGTPLTLSDVMDPDVQVVVSSAPVHDVVEIFSTAQGVRRTVVVDDLAHRHVVGVIADRDLVLRSYRQSGTGPLRAIRERLHLLTPEQGGEQIGARTAADVMSTNVVTAPGSMPLIEGVRLLVQRELKLLPVVDTEGKLLGVVHRSRVLRALVESAANAGGAHA